MAKQWKRSLSQSDILSDGTPFDGSNIDAPISSAGASSTDITNAVWSDDQQHGPSDLKAAAVDWSSKTAKGTITGSNLTVNGSGYLLFVYASDGDTNQELKIDGSSLFQFSDFTSGASLLYRFDSSFTVDGISSSTEIYYVID
jgi:hypothetical protein